MEIVGIEGDGTSEQAVSTIDVWYSPRRQAWMVERLDRDGNQLGLSLRCVDEEEAAICVGEWLRTHSETHLVSPRGLTRAEQRILKRQQRRRAA